MAASGIKFGSRTVFWIFSAIRSQIPNIRFVPLADKKRDIANVGCADKADSADAGLIDRT